MKSLYLKKVKLPDKPGVYLFKKNKQILYIGKATSLHDRTKSYVSKTVFDTRGPLIEKMVEEANKIDWQVADSVLEAIILEANLIKKHQPKYNTKEKSDKSFNYVCIAKEKIPKVVVVRGKNLHTQQGNFYARGSHFVPLNAPKEGRSAKNYLVAYANTYGPFTSGTQLHEALKLIRRIFPFLDEKSKNYMEFYKQINLVPDLNDRKMYLQNIKNIKLFFTGKKQQIFRNLKKEMKEYAKNREFEKAGEIKRQLFAIQHINDVALIKDQRQNVLERTLGRSGDDGVGNFSTENFCGESVDVSLEVFRLEAYDVAHMAGKNMVGVMTVVEDGEVVKSEYKKFKIRTQGDANDTGALREIIERRLAHAEWTRPSLIVVDGGVAQLNIGKKVLKSLNLDIPIVAVLKDEKHKPKDILGDKKLALKYEKEILLVNSEAHRFAINYHKNMRNKNFLQNLSK